jgi:hypothetical protein
MFSGLVASISTHTAAPMSGLPGIPRSGVLNGRS